MTLEELIDQFRCADPNRVVPVGIRNPSVVDDKTLYFQAARGLKIRVIRDGIAQLPGRILPGDTSPVSKDMNVFIRSTPWDVETIGPVMVSYMLNGGRAR